ncbi:MAG: MFS transporter [Pirellulales bacterium]
MQDQKLLYAVAFTRAAATSMIGVLLGIYLAQLGFSEARIGYVVGAGLAGAAVASLVSTLFDDRHGRRRLLVQLTLLAAAGILVVISASDALLAAMAAFFGMLNGTGRDRGAAVILDQAMLPLVTTNASRTRGFAAYHLWQDAGHAIGALGAAAPKLAQPYVDAPLEAVRFAVASAAALLAITALAYWRLSPAVEAAPNHHEAKVSPPTRRLLWRFSGLIGLDSLGSGFLTTALLSLFFYKQFSVNEGILGILFAVARLANAGSYLAAAELAKRIGLVNTMVFTHIPASLLLIGVGLAPTFEWAAALFLLREALVEMDVPTRQSYVMAVVRPEERTLASGLTHLVRMTGQAITPFGAGLFMQNLALATPLFVGAGIKLSYDVALYLGFRHVKPPEEAEGA